MLALIRLKDASLHHLDFGSKVDGPGDERAFLLWVLDDYPRRRDDIWRVSPIRGQELLTPMLAEFAADEQRLVHVISAMRFYAAPRPGAHELTELLADPRHAVRIAAIGALGSMGAYVAIPELTPFLHGADADERRAAAGALAKFGRRDLLPQLEAAARQDPALFPVLEHAGDRCEAVEDGGLVYLMEVTLDTDDYEDVCIVSPFGARSLARMLKDVERPEIVRIRIARVLGLTRQRKHGSPAALEVWQEPSTTPELRRMLTWALGRMQDARALPYFHDALVPGAGDQELTYLEAIGRIGRATSLGVLLNHHSLATDPPARETVRIALQRISAHASIEDAAFSPDSAGDPDWVYLITDDDTLVTEQPEALLLQELASADPIRRRDAAFALSFCSEASAYVPVLRAHAQSELSPSAARAAEEGASRLEARVARAAPRGAFGG